MIGADGASLPWSGLLLLRGTVFCGPRVVVGSHQLVPKMVGHHVICVPIMMPVVDAPSAQEPVKLAQLGAREVKFLVDIGQEEDQEGAFEEADTKQPARQKYVFDTGRQQKPREQGDGAVVLPGSISEYRRANVPGTGINRMMAEHMKSGEGTGFDVGKPMAKPDAKGRRIVIRHRNQECDRYNRGPGHHCLLLTFRMYTQVGSENLIPKGLDHGVVFRTMLVVEKM